MMKFCGLQGSVATYFRYAV